jgi:hypothetical protein
MDVVGYLKKSRSRGLEVVDEVGVVELDGGG